MGPDTRGRQVGLAVVLALVVILSACGRAPTSIAPTPSIVVDSSPTPASSPLATTSPIVGKTPAQSSSPTPTKVVRPSPSASPTVAPLKVVTPSFPPGELRIAYGDINLSATGGKPPYSWSISSGALPDGLGLSAGGVINGTPTVAGGFKFSVLVTDSAKSAVAAGGAIDIANYLSGNGTCTVGCSVEAGCITVCGSFAKPVGGVAPFKVSLASGALPPATTLAFPALAGQFTTPGAYTFVVSISDALGAKTSVSATFNVFAHIAMKVGTLPAGYIKIPYSASIAYGNGSGIPTVIVIKGALPPGLAVAVDPKLRTIVISGTPTAIGKYAFYLRLTDTSPCGPGYNCSVTSPVLSITILLG